MPELEPLRPPRRSPLARIFLVLVLAAGAVVLLFGAYIIWYAGIEHY